jgi:FAD/FMN-containing dehydrogenase
MDSRSDKPRGGAETDLPEIEGAVLTDPSSLDKYSRDMGGYHARPLAVVVPVTEADVEALVEHSKRTGIPLTPRGSGSNLSGSAVGEGFLMLFTRMSRVLAMTGRFARVQPGVKYDAVNAFARGRGLALRYDVSSGGFSTVGGNVATKAGGLRSVKYGTVDDALSHVRFVDTAHGVIDTAAGIPAGLERALLDLRARLLRDAEALSVLDRKRGVKSSSGYNLRALLDRPDPPSMAAHLMVGSAGTLGVFTELGMNLVPVPVKRSLSVAFFTDLFAAVRVAPQIAALKPSSCEVLDATCTALLGEIEPVPEEAGASLLVEFDEEIGRAQKMLGEVLRDKAFAFGVTEEEERMERIWEVRKSLLTRIKRLHEDREHRYISFVDDMAVPLPEMTGFIAEVERVFSEEEMKVVIYGHICEGNLHVRPLVVKHGWKKRVLRAAERCFTILLSRGGTLTAEHGPGRNRAAYLRREWGDRVYGYFSEVKTLFDPCGVLNPEVMFSDMDFTNGYLF